MADPVSRPLVQPRSTQRLRRTAEACTAALLASGPEGGMGSGLLHSMCVHGFQHAGVSAVRSSVVNIPISSTDRSAAPLSLIVRSPSVAICAERMFVTCTGVLLLHTSSS